MNGRKKADYVKPEELIVNELIQALESGNTKLWRKEWTVKGGFRNVLSGHTYKGSNPALLCLQSSKIQATFSRCPLFFDYCRK